jgi:hypothetical protein
MERANQSILLVSGLDDRDDKEDLLTLEAMCALSNVIAVMNENEVRPILMNVLLRIRPCFEKVGRTKSTESQLIDQL